MVSVPPRIRTPDPKLSPFSKSMHLMGTHLAALPLITNPVDPRSGTVANLELLEFISLTELLKDWVWFSAPGFLCLVLSLAALQMPCGAAPRSHE